ncbi:MAG TPA: PA4780 family RIO1-like protein kinase [Steroidobacteraceae bacterium]|jgi:RIO kinase 1|nr:PA4780 family RIO1-like protein kinase [Steroidobacteraceae bacterium]
MKTPAALQPLIDDGVIDEVIRSLKSGKEATVYLVRSGAHTRCAKVYRDMRQRSFQKRARYQEGRKVRGSRQARAIAKSTRFGRREQEAQWKNAEVDALYKLVAAGVRVPKPYGYFNDTLIMELVTDAAGDPAPRLAEVDLSAETAREYHRFLIQQVVRMLSIGLIHGDLSEFNVLIGSEGPVIIDLPQAVNAAGNNGALAMLERDVNNIRGTLSRFAPELLVTEFAREMWALFEQGELTADSSLTGVFTRDETTADADGVLVAVEDAREEALRRELGRESSGSGR